MNRCSYQQVLSSSDSGSEDKHTRMERFLGHTGKRYFCACLPRELDSLSATGTRQLDWKEFPVLKFDRAITKDTFLSNGGPWQSRQEITIFCGDFRLRDALATKGGKMETVPVLDDLTLFSFYAALIDLTFNKYLLKGKQSLLVHTGDRIAAAELAENLRAALRGQSLSYIFVSHFESDECGGLKLLLDAFSGAMPVYAAVMARQLSGFGITDGALIKKPGESLHGADFDIQFVSYPSEMHLREGLLAFDARRGLLFSEDLFIRRGQMSRPTRPLAWEEEIQAISPAHSAGRSTGSIASRPQEAPGAPRCSWTLSAAAGIIGPRGGRSRTWKR